MKFNKFLAVGMSAVLSLTLVGCTTTSSAKELKGEELNNHIKKVILNTQLTFHYLK